MLLLIGAIGLLVTIHRFRMPGVPFFTIITVFNRKQKLTETGSKVYLGFFLVAVLGLLLNFGSRGHGNVPADNQTVTDSAPAPRSSDAERAGIGSGAPDERGDDADSEKDARTDPDANGGYRMILDHLFVTYMMAGDPDAERFRDRCNDEMSSVLTESTVGGSRKKMWSALRQCTRFAESLCSSKALEPCGAFEHQSAAFEAGRY